MSVVRPLLVRPGARYVCFGDGLCCTDLHVLGPVGRREAREVREVRSDAVVANRRLAMMALRTERGSCVFLGESGCSIHVASGDRRQPSACRRFPFRLVATPLGGRAVTEHRCPCRTLGDRPLIALADAERALRAGGRALQRDATVGDRIALTTSKTVSFAAYARVEAELLAALLGSDPRPALDAFSPDAFPALSALTWVDVAHLYRAQLDGTACTVALAWFGDALLGLHGDRWPTPRDRPWSLAFDRAERRSPTIADAKAIFADWLADAVWSLEWVEDGSLARARTDLASRLAVARAIAGRLTGAGVRSDRAAAEAVTIVELAGAAALWRGVLREVSVRV